MHIFSWPCLGAWFVIKCSKNHSQILIFLAQAEDWAANKLGVRIVVFSGRVVSGSCCTNVYYPTAGNCNGDVWLFYSVCRDPAGHSATHFDLISKALNFQGCLF